MLILPIILAKSCRLLANHLPTTYKVFVKCLPTLANYLSFQDRHAANPKLHIENPEEDVDRELEPPIDELVAAHLRACWAVSKKDFVEAYKCQALSVQNVCKLLSSEKDSNWPLPMMYALCLDLRLFALKADDQLSHKGGKPGKNTVTVL